MTRNIATAASAALAMIVASCSSSAEPRAQWTVAIVTDASVPQFGDRLLVEVLDADGTTLCPSCRRPFPVDEHTAWPVEFGITPPASGTPPRVRVRLHRSDHTGADGLPSDTGVIDAVGALPRVDGIHARRYHAVDGLLRSGRRPRQQDVLRSVDSRPSPGAADRFDR